MRRVRLEAKVWEAGNRSLRLETRNPHALIDGQRVVLLDTEGADDLEERAAEVGWWSEIADSPGVYRVTVEEDEDGEVTYSSTQLSDVAADPVAEERRVVLECERALQAQYPYCLIFLAPLKEPDNWGNLWEASLWQPDCDLCDVATARGKTGAAAALALRASLEPEGKPCPHEEAKWEIRYATSESLTPGAEIKGWWVSLQPEMLTCLGGAGDDCLLCNKPLPPEPEQAVPETIEECEDEVRRINNPRFYPQAVHSPGVVGCPNWNIRHADNTYPCAETELEAWQAAVRAARQEARNERP